MFWNSGLGVNLSLTISGDCTEIQLSLVSKLMTSSDDSGDNVGKGRGKMMTQWRSSG
jgi:hypothetical protein